LRASAAAEDHKTIARLPKSTRIALAKRVRARGRSAAAASEFSWHGTTDGGATAYPRDQRRPLRRTGNPHRIVAGQGRAAAFVSSHDTFGSRNQQLDGAVPPHETRNTNVSCHGSIPGELSLSRSTKQGM